MSLETLIDTVHKQTSLSSEEDVIKNLYRLINVLPPKFSEEKFNHILETEENYQEFKKIISIMSDLDFIRKKLHIECLDKDESYTSNNLDENCKLCLHDINDLNHEVKKVYSFNKELATEITKRHDKTLLNHYLIGIYKRNLTSLEENKSYLIPFYGAGLSVPLGYPSWGGMLWDLSIHLEEDMQPPYKRYIENGEYLKALEYLQEHSIITTEADIKEEILKNFSQAEIKDAFSAPNNYLDLFDLKSEFYITTNYDNALTSLATKLGPFTLPYTLEDLKDVPSFLRENRQRVLHLHGNIEKSETMIVTKNDYELLYNGGEIVQKLLAIMGTKSFLFLGFSFQDEFFKELYMKITSQIKGNHFIIMPNISLKDAQILSKNNLKVIGINVETDAEGRYVTEDYVQGIKTILKQLL